MTQIEDPDDRWIKVNLRKAFPVIRQPADSDRFDDLLFRLEAAVARARPELQSGNREHPGFPPVSSSWRTRLRQS